MTCWPTDMYSSLEKKKKVSNPNISYKSTSLTNRRHYQYIPNMCIDQQIFYGLGK